MAERSLDRAFRSLLGNIPLSRLLSCVFAIMLLITVAVISYLIINSSRKTVDSVVVRLAYNIAHEVTAEVETFLATPDLINTNTQQAIQANRIQIQNFESLSRFLWDAAHRNLESLVTSIYFATTEGSFISVGVADSHHPEDDQVFSVSAPFTEGIYTDFLPNPNGTLGDKLELHGKYDPRVRPWYKQAIATPSTAVWSAIYSDFDTGEATLTRAIAVQDENGSIVGVAAVDLFIEHLQEFLETLTLSEHTQVFILADNNLLIASTTPGVTTDKQTHNIPTDQSPYPYTRAAVSYINTNEIIQNAQLPYDGTVSLNDTEGLLYAAPLGHLSGVNWTMGIFLPKKDFIGSFWDQTKFLLPLMLVALLIAIAALRGLLSLVVKPLRQLKNDASLIAAGDFSVPIDIQSNNEVGELARSFDNMRSKLSSTFEDLILRDRAIAEVDVGILIIDASISKRPIIYVNKAYETMTGYTSEELIGHSPHMLVTDHDQTTLREFEAAFESKFPSDISFKNHKRDGSEYPCEISISPVRNESGETTHYIGVQKDITERINSETQLRQAQKNDAIGQLSGGIAHDFNNLLSVVSGRLELIDATVNDESVQHHIAEASHAADMGARLTHRLLAFARQGSLEPSVVNLNDQVASALTILKATIGDNIQIQSELDSSIWLTYIDPSEIENTVINLTINARDAMPDGGVIQVHTANITLDTQAALAISVPAGDYVQLTITDTGIGMSEDTQAHIFEPFYTTKTPEKGTGLGLSSIYGFARQSGGNIIVRSDTTRGTSFQLYLPRHSDQPDEERPARDTPVPASDHSIQMLDGIQHRILVVEDNASVREVSVARLLAMGYLTIEAESGAAALKILQADNAIDMIFCDLDLPGGMSGQEVADWVHTHIPTCKILLTSGFSDKHVVGMNAGSPRWRVLQKPYKTHALQKAVEPLLAELDAE